MAGGRKRGGATVDEENGDGGGGYEKLREQRIKENMERMQKLGIFELSKKLKPPPPPSKIRRTLPSSDQVPLSLPPRRSSRLKAMTPVSYAEKREKRSWSQSKSSGSDDEIDVEINIGGGSKPEIYTEEDEKLLGDSKKIWTLRVDGYDQDGLRVYDPVNGETCHQCRLKTLARHTHCSKCKMVQGQLCGDCLYTRYGENVIEVDQNPDWICPVCRGICNCIRCRLRKGWKPTGDIYRKVKKLGFESVAHYLIHTYCSRVNSESLVDEDEGPSLHSLPDETMDMSVKSEDAEQGEEKEVQSVGSNNDDNDADIN